MAVPETITVRYTEEEAEYLSVRPVVRQTFRIEELFEMILGVTGKDRARLHQILRAGTIVFHSYRYWWPGFELDGKELETLLERFPDADPQRAFRAADCDRVIFESGGHPARHTFELTRAEASARRFLRSGSFWESIIALAASEAPSYRCYSYERRADLYESSIAPGQREALVADASRLASRKLRGVFARLPEMTRVVFVCPRRQD